MGQKVNPHGLRVGVIKDWNSKWYADTKNDEFANNLVEDYNIRKYLKKRLYDASISKIDIERTRDRVKISLYTAKPGIVIGKGGAEIEKLKEICSKRLGGKEVSVNIIEIKQPDLNAQLVAESIASQIERRISHRRAIKQAIGRTMKLGARGIKIQCSGRLGGREIAGSETYHEGTIPLQTIRADIDYGFTEAKTTYGRIGVKVWLYRGEVPRKARPGSNRPRRRRDNRDGREARDNREGGNR